MIMKTYRSFTSDIHHMWACYSEESFYVARRFKLTRNAGESEKFKCRCNNRIQTFCCVNNTITTVKQQLRTDGDVRTDVSDVINANHKPRREVACSSRDFGNYLVDRDAPWSSLSTTYVYRGWDPCWWRINCHLVLPFHIDNYHRGFDEH